MSLLTNRGSDKEYTMYSVKYIHFVLGIQNINRIEKKDISTCRYFEFILTDQDHCLFTYFHIINKDSALSEEAVAAENKFLRIA